MTSLSSLMSKLRTLQFSPVKFFLSQNGFNRFQEVFFFGWVAKTNKQLGSVETPVFQPVFGKIAIKLLYGRIAKI